MGSMMNDSSRRRVVGVAAVLSVLIGALTFLEATYGVVSSMWGRARGGYTVAERLEAYGPAVADRLEKVFKRVALEYPPRELAYLAFKDTRVLEVYARTPDSGEWRFVTDYPVLAASGELGPKLAEGDYQVPEGIYRIELLNPNSRFHLSLRLNYPNEFDRAMAVKDGRTRLGGDIMIHGKAASVGCLAIGDRAAEDLFVLSALASKERVRVLISPTDFRQNPQPGLIEEPRWVRDLYADLRAELRQYRREPGRALQRTPESGAPSELAASPGRP